MPTESTTPGTNAHSTGEQMRQAAREQAGELWRDAREATRSRLDSQKHTAASGIGQIAAALRTSARELEGKEQGTVARLAHGAAESLDQISSSLERRDLEGLVRDAESFARRQPAAFFGAALAAGFLAVRFLKSAPQPTPAPDQ